MWTLVRILIPAAVLLAAGCGGPTAGTVADEPVRGELSEVYELFRLHQTEKGRPPRRLADLDRYAPGMDLGYSALQAGRVTPVWGAGADEASTEVLACEKKVPADGGWVLLRNGTVKQMTAEEYKAAPKAK